MGGEGGKWGQRQEDCPMFEASLLYTVSFKPIRATGQGPIIEHNNPRSHNHGMRIQWKSDYLAFIKPYFPYTEIQNSPRLKDKIHTIINFVVSSSFVTNSFMKIYTETQKS